jgi:hypothetical protein
MNLRRDNFFSEVEIRYLIFNYSVQELLHGYIYSYYFILHSLSLNFQNHASETGSDPVIRWKEENVHTPLGPLQTAILCH